MNKQQEKILIDLCIKLMHRSLFLSNFDFSNFIKIKKENYIAKIEYPLEFYKNKK